MKTIQANNALALYFTHRLTHSFTHQRLYVHWSAEDVVFHVPSSDGLVIEFHQQRKTLGRLKSRVICDKQGVRLSLLGADGNKLIVKALDPRSANDLLHDVRKAKQLLSRSYWSKSAVKSFIVGLLLGGVTVVVSAFWVVGIAPALALPSAITPLDLATNKPSKILSSTPGDSEPIKLADKVQAEQWQP